MLRLILLRSWLLLLRFVYQGEMRLALRVGIILMIYGLHLLIHCGLIGGLLQEHTVTCQVRTGYLYNLFFSLSAQFQIYRSCR